jgi:hypothetical protein
VGLWGPEGLVSAPSMMTKAGGAVRSRPPAVIVWPGQFLDIHPLQGVDPTRLG